MTQTEAIEDLAIMHYPGKWKKAQEMAHGHIPEHHVGLDYWGRARKFYLELGGEFIGQLSFWQRLRYLLPTDAAHKA